MPGNTRIRIAKKVNDIVRLPRLLLTVSIDQAHQRQRENLHVELEQILLLRRERQIFNGRRLNAEIPKLYSKAVYIVRRKPGGPSQHFQIGMVFVSGPSKHVVPLIVGVARIFRRQYFIYNNKLQIQKCGLCDV